MYYLIMVDASLSLGQLPDKAIGPCLDEICKQWKINVTGIQAAPELVTCT